VSEWLQAIGGFVSVMSERACSKEIQSGMIILKFYLLLKTKLLAFNSLQKGLSKCQPKSSLCRQWFSFGRKPPASKTFKPDGRNFEDACMLTVSLIT
jgi:hypothetical protein